MSDPKDMTDADIVAMLVTDGGVSVETLGGNPIRPGSDRWPDDVYEANPTEAPEERCEQDCRMSAPISALPKGRSTD